MIPKPISEIQDTDLLALRENEVPESKTIEYKRDLPGTSEMNRREFLKDVSAFANTLGGDLLYGIDAVEGVPRNFPGIGNVNEDELQLRLENLCRDGLEPRLPRIDFHVLPVSGGRVLMIRVSKSWASPHRVRLAGHGHFYARGGAGTFQMDVTELRTAFTSSEGVTEKIRNFRMERLAFLRNFDTPTPILRGCRFAVHLVPLSAFASSDRIDVTQNHVHMQNFWPFAATEHPQTRINLEGVLNFTPPHPENGSRAYTQVYRTGVIESVAVFAESREDGKRIHSTKPELYLIDSLPRYLEELQALQVTTPIYILLSLVGTTGYSFLVPDGRGLGFTGSATDRDLISLPEVVLNDFGVDVGRVLRPAFDMLWNAFGYSASQNYDRDGNWVRR